MNERRVSPSQLRNGHRTIRRPRNARIVSDGQRRSDGSSCSQRPRSPTGAVSQIAIPPCDMSPRDLGPIFKNLADGSSTASRPRSLARDRNGDGRLASVGDSRPPLITLEQPGAILYRDRSTRRTAPPYCSNVVDGKFGEGSTKVPLSRASWPHLRHRGRRPHGLRREEIIDHADGGVPVWGLRHGLG